MSGLGPEARRAGQGFHAPDQRALSPLAVDLDGLLSVDPTKLDRPFEVSGGRFMAREQILWRPTPVRVVACLAECGQLVRCDPTGGGFTVTLPPAKGLDGRAVAVKNVSASVNTITISPADGGTTTIASAWGAKWLVAAGGLWLSV